MNILKDSQLVISSHSTTFITFFYKSLAAGFFSNSCKVRGGENRKSRWIFAFDHCVEVPILLLNQTNEFKKLISSYPFSMNAGGPFSSSFLAQHLLRCRTRSESGEITRALKYNGVFGITSMSRSLFTCLILSRNISNENENCP